MHFSIVVPLYNKEYSVIRCIESILAQTYKRYELIIVDDGSTDDSLMLVRKNYEKEIDKRLIKILSQRNMGVSVARNNGVKKAQFNYICFLDADDEWENSFLHHMSLLIQDFPDAELYSFGHKMVKRKNKAKKRKSFLMKGHRGYVKDFYLASLQNDIVNSSKVCLKKDSLLSIGGFPPGVVSGEDYYVWIMLWQKGQFVYEDSYLSIIHGEKDFSRAERKNSVPYPLVFFSENKTLPKSVSFYLYISVIFFKHFIMSLLNKNFKEAGLRLYFFLKALR